MKTKSILYLFAAVLLSGSLALTSCKKKKAAKNEDAQTSQDNQSVQSNADAAINDANVAIGDYPKLTGKGTKAVYPSILTTICGASVDTANLQAGSVKINYNGTVCNNVKREGSIRVTVVDHAGGKRWKIAGCVVKVDYIDYKVTKASNGKSIKFNGTHYVTNVTGGTLAHIFLNIQPTLIHTITGSDLQVTFDDEKTATWNISRKYTYTYSALVFTCTGEGTGSYNNLSTLENWGTTRDGDEFTSQVNTPVVWNTTCGAWAPIKGEITLKVTSKDFYLHAVFGVDKGGVIVTPAPNTCAYGWKVDWKYKNKTRDKIIAY